MLNRLRDWATEYEPARATAFLAAAIALAGTLGYGQVATDLEPVANAVLGLISAVVVLLAGERTRANVYAPPTVNKILHEQAESFPDATMGDEPLVVTAELEDEVDAMGRQSEPGEHKRA